jgi:hypothetical protein
MIGDTRLECQDESRLQYRAVFETKDEIMVRWNEYILVDIFRTLQLDTLLMIDREHIKYRGGRSKER